VRTARFIVRIAWLLKNGPRTCDGLRRMVGSRRMKNGRPEGRPLAAARGKDMSRFSHRRGLFELLSAPCQSGHVAERADRVNDSGAERFLVHRELFLPLMAGAVTSRVSVVPPSHEKTSSQHHIFLTQRLVRRRDVKVEVRTLKPEPKELVFHVAPLCSRNRDAAESIA